MKHAISPTTRRRRLAVAAVVVGLAAGGLAAAVVARDAPPAAPAPDRFLPLPGTARVAPATTQDRGPNAGAPRLRLQPGSTRTDVRRPDPSGGAPWAIRTFFAQRVQGRAFRRAGTDGAMPMQLCAQLGREVGGTFGWIDAGNTFRPVPVGNQNAVPTRCGSRAPDRTGKPLFEVSIPITDPSRADATVRGSVVWGVVGRDVASATVTAAGRTLKPARSTRRGAFLEFVGPRRSAADAHLAVVYPSGRTAMADYGGGAPFPAPAQLRLRPETARVAARAPDPGGGPSWGRLELQTAGGSWCALAAGYLLGGQVGTIDAELGLLWPEPLVAPGNCPRPGDLTGDHVIWPGIASGSATDIPQLDPARDALRLQPGRFILTGQAHPDIELVTIRSPRDTRSVIPTGRSHAFVVVYDGDMTSGSIVLTARFRDGSTRDVRVSTGM